MLTEHIAVMDLMALADALLLPEDDLALASVLKSPLFGFDRRAAVRAGAGSARARCAPRCARRPAISTSRGVNERLDRYAAWARHESPFAFYARMLGADQGRARFYARLGAEAADALDEFLEHALTMSGTKRRRCRASSPGCAPATRR